MAIDRLRSVSNCNPDKLETIWSKLRERHDKFHHCLDEHRACDKPIRPGLRPWPRQELPVEVPKPGAERLPVFSPPPESAEVPLPVCELPAGEGDPLAALA